MLCRSMAMNYAKAKRNPNGYEQAFPKEESGSRRSLKKSIERLANELLADAAKGKKHVRTKGK